MSVDVPGIGTALNVCTVLIGAGLGIRVGHRLSERTRTTVTDCLGLITLLMAGLSAMAVRDAAFSRAVGSHAPVLIVLGSLLVGAVLGSAVGIEERLESLAGALQGRLAGRTESAAPGPKPRQAQGGAQVSARQRFIEGWLTASLLFCVGPLTILGSLSDGLGHGIDQLAVKSVLDGFAAMAFATTFGIGVLFSALSVLVVQGVLTAVGVLLGSVVPEAPISALTATGGLLLVAIALRLLRIRQIRVGDLLPALILAPVLAAVVTALR